MRILQKILLWILLVCVLVGVLIGGTLAFFYVKTDATDFAFPQVTFAGQALTPSDGTWNTPVLNGVLYKPYLHAATLPRALTAVDVAQVPVSVPANFSYFITIRDEAGQTVLQSEDAETPLAFTSNGTYTGTIVLEQPQRDGKAYGSFQYDFSFTMEVQPKIEFSETKITQGGVVTVLVSGIMDEGMLPEIETALSLTCFAKTEQGLVSFIGMHYNREPGDYPVTVRYGGLETTQTITVVHRDFEKQYMTIDEDISASTNDSAAANAEWRDAIWPLYELADTDVYWKGQFTWPTENHTINTAYGLFRYTNGSTSAERHAGIDIDGNEGDIVRAAGRGRVVYSGFLQLTGNTVVIEHGAGLKTFYFHMASLTCSQNEMVEKTQQIGTVGTTGYSTGPHLHFDARIGNQSIDPLAILRGSSGIYFIQ